MSDQYRGQDTKVDPKLLAEWTARNRAARRAYEQTPNAVTRKIYKAAGK